MDFQARAAFKRDFSVSNQRAFDVSLAVKVNSDPLRSVIPTHEVLDGAFAFRLPGNESKGLVVVGELPSALSHARSLRLHAPGRT